MGPASPCAIPGTSAHRCQQLRPNSDVSHRVYGQKSLQGLGVGAIFRPDICASLFSMAVFEPQPSAPAGL